MSPHYDIAATTVVLLAAGHGKRMRPLTNHTPKPLLKIGEYALIEHHLHRIKALGFGHVVINIAHLGEQLPAKLGTGERYGLSIEYSDERRSGPLETAGGLKHALPLINSDPFIAVNADIWTNFDFTQLLYQLHSVGRLVMVANPEHNPQGDFTLINTQSSNDRLRPDAVRTYLLEKLVPGRTSRTYSGIALYTKTLFVELGNGKQALSPVFQHLIAQQQLEGLPFDGVWHDVGTPERLKKLNQTYEAAQ